MVEQKHVKDQFNRLSDNKKDVQSVQSNPESPDFGIVESIVAEAV